MIVKIFARDRYHADHGWLSTYLLFSFAEYYDPKNTDFGALRVFNDDTVAPHSGFSEHDHDNMEIVTIVHKGALTHRDSLGNTGTICAGDVQYMSAGTGVTHAEMNDGEESVHLYQIWLYPRERGLLPCYKQKNFSQFEKNILVPVVSGEGLANTLPIRTDATIYIGEFEAGKTIEHALAPDRGLFVYVREGELEINGERFESGDQAKFMQERSLHMHIRTSAYVTVVQTVL